MIGMKIPVRTYSLLAAILCWLLFSALTVFIIWGMRDRARLIRDNDNEQILNMLFTGLRGHDDFGSAIEANPALRDRISGFAIYDAMLRRVYQWGKTPPVFDEKILEGNTRNSRYGRYTIPDKKGHSVKFVLHIERMAPMPPPLSRRDEPRRRDARHNFLFFNSPLWGKYFYIDISHPAYWRTITFTTILLPLCSLALLALAFYIRNLYIRNGEYRERIEAQKNLVVLGTAASTLAHEIKNPLLSIRLQTGILGKLFPDNGRDEIRIIDEETERLSALIYRVNDYLRDAGGNRVPINAGEILTETGRRLCGRDISVPGSLTDGFVFMDAGRLRSVFENIIRNALESEGPSGAIGASLSRNGANIVITIFDRGKGISAEDMKRAFDPFFTRKSAGTGIGLSVSRRFIEAAAGSIVLENREGGGTLVRIVLPEYNGEKP
jgi:two-component system sensor histidine kinase HydH